MKKIININMSGRVIPIEDSAYEKLQSYIESLRRYFAKEQDRDEIINDIESRIAELMSEKIRKGAPCITDADINEIAASMGRPEDFDADAKEETTSSYQASQEQSAYTERKTKRRLYRDTSDKFIGGVCSGIAAYLNVDPSIVRILFAIITFGGFGLGFVAYILLWAILPEKENQHYTGKRLYRNPEDRILGGVAGGLAAYFNRETWVVRLIFAAPFVFSIFLGFLRGGVFWDYDFDFVPNIVFGSLSSSFVLAYIILWIVLPEANSTYEKMEMRGEKVDVNSIRKNMKERVKDWTDEVKESAENMGNKAREFANTKGKTFGTEVKEVSRRAGSGIGHAIGVLFKVFFIFIAGTIAFALFVGLMALLFGGIAWWPINNFLWTSKWQQLYAWSTLIFFFLVPLIAFIVWLIRRIVGVRSRNSYLGWVFGSLWAIGWVAATLFAFSAARDFSVERYNEKPLSVSQPANGRMIVVVSQPELEYTGRFDWINDDGDGWDLSPDSLKLSWVNFDIDKSTDSFYHVAVRSYSFGKTSADAESRAQNVQYTVTSVDSMLDLANGFSIYRDQKFRGQHIEILIRIPVGKKIRFDESVRRKLNSGEVTYRRRNRKNGFDMMVFDKGYFWWRSDTDYIMQEDGRLMDASSRKVIDNDYRYEGEWNDPADPQQQQNQNNNEDSAAQKQKSKETKREKSSGVAESMDDNEDEGIVSAPFPAFSLVRTFF
jgi:phage shock protein PspC (stress-responsive transcriptional regulator)